MSDTRRLYLVRHGEAKPKNEDPERGLTEAGYANVSEMANWVAYNGIHVGDIRHSSKLRARQTAEIFGRCLGATTHATDGLAPHDDVAKMAEAIADNDGAIMLVGHLPFLERLAALLTVGNTDCNVVNLDAGALLELTAAGDDWRITCLMQPRLIP